MFAKRDVPHRVVLFWNCAVRKAYFWCYCPHTASSTSAPYTAFLALQHTIVQRTSIAAYIPRAAISSMENFLEGRAVGGDAFAPELNGEPFRLRSYQAEMVKESMHANIICVMDTGSGKTHM
jgi:hypothetical protein